MAYLNESHPEVFKTPPRPGGMANIVPLGESTIDKSQGGAQKSVTFRTEEHLEESSTMSKHSFFDMEPTPLNITREQRVKKILSNSRWLMPDPECQIEDEGPEGDNPFNDEQMILSAMVSTVMLMAVGYSDVPKDHLQWTLSYIQCVKDDYGDCPPNIAGLVNQIRELDGSIKSFLEKDEPKPESPPEGDEEAPPPEE